MIKAIGTLNGRKTLLIGLSFGNLDRFRAEPGDTFIKIDGKAMELPFDALIFSGATEADCLKAMERGVGPDTKVHPVGPTGDYPRGQLNPHDEGALKVAIGHESGVVRLDFGEPTAWIGLPPDEALTLAAVLVSHATALKGGGDAS